MDDLTQLKGIGKATAARLVAAGITSFSTLAATLPEQFQAIDKLGGTSVDWLGWAEQARSRAATPVDLKSATPDQVSDHAARIDAARTKLDEAGKAAAAAALDESAEAYETARQAVADAQAELDRLIGHGSLSPQQSQPSTPPAGADTTNSANTTPESEAEDGEAGDTAAGLPGIKFQLAATFGPAVAALDERVMGLFNDVSPEAATAYLADQLTVIDEAIAHMSTMRAEIQRLELVVTRTTSIWPLEAIRFDGMEQAIGVELRVEPETATALISTGAAADHPPTGDGEVP